MKKLYTYWVTAWMISALPTLVAQSQPCSALTARCMPYESRCAATGSIRILPSGGSGNYKFRVSGPVSTNFTSVDSITGLPAGSYTVSVSDITSGCTVDILNVGVPGTYSDPRFTLNVTDVSCDNGNNGRITLATLSNGRAPFRYAIVAPSAMGVGTSNSTGTFNNLIAGNYTIRLTDSCGGIQTRLVTILNYTWRLDSVRFSKTSCNQATGYIRASDSRGNISTVNGVPGLRYGIVRGAGDTLWSNSPFISFNTGTRNQFEAVVKDGCGIVKKMPFTLSFRPALGASVNMYGQSCTGFSAAVVNAVNFFSPRYCLYTSGGTLVSCNNTGVFTGLDYGSYCIRAYDSCADTTLVRCFTGSPPPASVAATVRTFNRTCTNFSASITGEQGLTNPRYCLYDSTGSLIRCNTSGNFHQLSYGSYCIRVSDTCRDTTIVRCFTARPPVPVIPTPVPSGFTCDRFNVQVTGDSLGSPRFCLYDSAGNIIACNATGSFDSLLYGNYCVQVYDSCYDTTLTRCFGATGPSLQYGLGTQISNRACSTFTATVTSGGLLQPEFCLYRADSTLVACNSTGVFNNLPYGAYFTRVRNQCPDTTLVHWLSAYPSLPSLSGSVRISNRTCATFNAAAQGMQNLTNPRYCLYDSAGVLIRCNTSGSFSNIRYGNYCIRVTDGCYDTTISRCFSAAPLPVSMRVSTRRSCTYGSARLTVTVTGGVLPVQLTIYAPGGNQIFSSRFSNSNIVVDPLPGLSAEQRYKVVVTDNCGMIDSAFTQALPSQFLHQPRMIPRCPSATWTNGSGTIETRASSNTGSVTVRIIRKNGTALSPQIAPSSVSGTLSTFNNLGPGTYILRYTINDGCNRPQHDTVVVPEYRYPGLERSAAYQCDNNGFSIGAVVTNGVGPFQYEIIGSSPAVPSIVRPPQTNPVFSINNGNTYSLVRLRVLDACGNASLGDASILPLANNGITSDYNCFQLFANLRVDTVYNSTYAWYRKHTMQGTDSTYIGNTTGIYIPSLTPSDTGLYVCHIVVNSGCIRRSYYYRLDGSCYRYLPVVWVNLQGKYPGGRAQLQWEVGSVEGVRRFGVEMQDESGRFSERGIVEVPADHTGRVFAFTDPRPGLTEAVYRIRVERYNGTVEYSALLRLSPPAASMPVKLYPNPAKESVQVELATRYKRCVIQWYTIDNRLINSEIRTNNGLPIRIDKPIGSGTGIYLLRIQDLESGATWNSRVLFR